MNRSAQFILRPAPSPSRANCVKFIWSCPNDWMVTVKSPTRSLEQNALMHSVLAEMVQANFQWHGRRMDVEDLKDLLAASLKTSAQIDQDTVPGIDGGIVVLGSHTSDLTIKEMSEIIERAYCIGAQFGVKFRERVEPTGRPR